MCGILGIVAPERTDITAELLDTLIGTLLRLSETRGKEAAGLAVRRGQGDIQVFKCEQTATRMLRRKDYREFFQAAVPPRPCDQGSLIVIGHTRLMTHGQRAETGNNQPVIKNGLVGVHNGILANDEALWRANPDIQREHQIDTELLLGLLARGLRAQGDLARSFRQLTTDVEGTISLAAMGQDVRELMLATNHGSLYVLKHQWRGGKMLFFASEQHILQMFQRSKAMAKLAGESNIVHLPADHVALIDPSCPELHIVNTAQDEPARLTPILSDIQIVDYSRRYEEARRELRRCTKCILPETMPFIEFDEQGVCSYCRAYKKMEVKGLDALMEAVAPFRKDNGEPDCLVMFSGGRDSSHGLHITKKVLGLTPLVFTYDWGVLTDLGRRNQARMCGALGVEHLLVSADIPRKRRHVRSNVAAWLKRPHLGMVPLFMAGDKQYFYHAKKVAKQADIKLTIVSECPLERTKFKSGFCGVAEGSKRIFNVSIWQKFRMIGFYLGQFLRNPAYINASLWDSFTAFMACYGLKHDFLYLYDYVRWDEEEIAATLKGEYNWETAEDTKTTWRIGDGTAAFYNHIYYTIAGFTENDVLRSHQVLEGVLTRDQALELTQRDNQPRWPSMEWYAHTIGFSLDHALSVINSVPKLYE